MSPCFSGQQLREARIAAGLKREHLAFLVDRSVYSVREWECGRMTPGGNVVAALAHTLNIPIQDLYCARETIDVPA